VRRNHDTESNEAAGRGFPRTPSETCLRLSYFTMIKNSERQKQKRKEEEERKRRAAKWLANFIDAVAVSADGTERVLEGDEAAEAILRQWEREEE
jgi:hypothetical protein